MDEIKNIILDLGVVILNVDYEKTIDAFTKLGVTNAADIYSKAQHKIRFSPVGLDFGIRIMLSLTRLSLAQQCPAQLDPAPLRSSWLDLGLPAPITAWLSSAWIGSYLFCSALLVSAWLSCGPTVKRRPPGRW